MDTDISDNSQGAEFSDGRTYRYHLTRYWDARRPVVAFLMLNPSTADETTLDPTCRRCLGYAKEWGYGKLIVGNIFALRATDPDELYRHDDPIGPDNDEWLRSIADEADKLIAAWGQHGDLHNRGPEVVKMLDADLYALDTTKDGHPIHPLYQPKDLEPEPFSYET